MGNRRLEKGVKLEWGHDYIRNRHYAGSKGNGNKEQGNDYKWIIKDKRTFGACHKPPAGYDLYIWNKKRLKYAKTVEELKQIAQEMEDNGD